MICKTFAPTTPLYLGEAFEIPKDFSRKVLCVRVWGGSPNIQCTQKARQCRAFLFCQNVLERRSKPCFKGLLKKSLKNPQNFHTGYTTLFRRKRFFCLFLNFSCFLFPFGFFYRILNIFPKSLTKYKNRL